MQGAHPYRPPWPDCGQGANLPRAWSDLIESTGQVRNYLNTQTLKASVETSGASMSSHGKALLEISMQSIKYTS